MREHAHLIHVHLARNSVYQATCRAKQAIAKNNNTRAQLFSVKNTVAQLFRAKNTGAQLFRAKNTRAMLFRDKNTRTQLFRGVENIVM